MLNKFLPSIMKSCIKRSVVSFFVFHTAISVKQLGKKIILFFLTSLRLEENYTALRGNVFILN